MKKHRTTTRKAPARRCQRARRRPSTIRKPPARRNRNQAHPRRRAKQLPPGSGLLFDLFDTVLTAALIANLVDEAIGAVMQITRRVNAP